MIVQGRGVASSKQVRGPQHNMLAITNVNQDIETELKRDKNEGAMAPLGPIVATPVVQGNTIDNKIPVCISISNPNPHMHMQLPPPLL